LLDECCYVANATSIVDVAIFSRQMWNWQAVYTQLRVAAGRNANSKQPIVLAKLPVSGACCKLDGTLKTRNVPTARGAVMQAVKIQQP